MRCFFQMVNSVQDGNRQKSSMSGSPGPCIGRVTDEVRSANYTPQEARRLVKDDINNGAGCPGKSGPGALRRLHW